MKADLKGKAIYKPKGKAGEYAEWACNFYVGCSNGCEYCYLKKGRGAKILGGDKPTLKKCFKDESDAIGVFKKELDQNLSELQKCGLFFSFTTDPMLPETKILTNYACSLAVEQNIPVKILTKRSDWVDDFIYWIENSNSDNAQREWRKMYAYGFTLTGRDELEPNTNTNAERIEVMRKLHDAGFKTFASIEPVIDFESSLQMLWAIRDHCDMAKVGLESGRKYNKSELRDFMTKAIFWANGDRMCYESLRFKGFKIYFKDGLLKQAGVNREDLPGNCVSRDYNIFQLWKQKQKKQDK